MNHLKRILTSFSLLLVATGCSALGQQGYVDVSVRTANYTEMSVDYILYDQSGKNLGMGGRANPFSKGGTGGSSCCAMLPGPGETIRVSWDEIPPGRSKGTTRHYTRDVVVIGPPPIPHDAYDYMITRFFPNQQVEVELVSEPEESLENWAPSPRRDQLFYGRRVMRQIGE
ncbi:hypothetical protein HDG34_003157 [Paraburkholderia sp. HC6.4b]|uniref:DUF3304 domain-containing protein n=1 Tax=unclassified Paraburkholderia TaxID=2615204 RepID=UPI00161BBED9|nr:MULTISPECIES: DUF3304 domain-containing protein [unclassified Paraburkholderia]MBB5409216.1 hypothetical protein [Paraburkholderia sp. HC6.4b]MBB5450944.1 hypothetical protein [Paraburkholderia sp. Kb1A]